jgi:hypothetical protein
MNFLYNSVILFLEGVFHMLYDIFVGFGYEILFV